MEKIIFTDLDKTVTASDSYTRSLFYFGNMGAFVINLPFLIYSSILYLTGFKSRDEMKELTFKIFYRGRDITLLKKKCGNFVAKVVFNKKVVDLISDYRKEGYKTVLVSASPDIYLADITARLGYEGYICTGVEIDDKGILTGNLQGGNCNYEEKVNKIKRSAFYNEASDIIALGNSKGDYAMLKFAREYYYVKKGIPYKNYKLSND